MQDVIQSFLGYEYDGIPGNGQHILQQLLLILHSLPCALAC